MPGLLDLLTANEPVELSARRKDRLREMRHNLGNRSRNFSTGANDLDLQDLEADDAEDPFTGDLAHQDEHARENEAYARASFMSPEATEVRDSQQQDALARLLAPIQAQGANQLAVAQEQGRTARDVGEGHDLAMIMAAKAKNQGGSQMASSLKERVAGTQVSLDTLHNLRHGFKDEFVGPAGGRMRTFGQSIPLLPVNPDFARFSADSATLKNAIIKAITGAQMSEPEAKRITEQIPMVTDKPDVWRAKADASEQNLRMLLQRIAELSGGAGMPQQDDDNDPYSDPNWGR